MLFKTCAGLVYGA